MRKQLAAVLIAISVISAPLAVAADDSSCGVRVEEGSEDLALVGGMENEPRIYDYLTTQLHYNKAAACGVLASMKRESNYTPNVYSSTGKYYGLCQWGGGRQTNLFNFCAQHGYDAASLEGQLAFFAYEIKTGYSKVDSMLLGTANTAQGAYNAGYNFVAYYEGVPAYGDSRGNLASSMFQTLNYGSGGSSTGSTGSSVASYDYSSVFDAAYYSDKYSDLKAAFGTNESALLNHFVTYGMSEGRQACATFDVHYYKAAYADLQAAFGNDLKKYYIHYIQFGKNEGRVAVGNAQSGSSSTEDSSTAEDSSTTEDSSGTEDSSSSDSGSSSEDTGSESTSASVVYNGLDYAPVYEYTYYIEKYGDLKAAFGTNESAAFNHFIVYGMKEGRQAKESFNWLIYRDRYPDLKAAFGNNSKAYYTHYLTYGIKEGRSAQ